MHPSETVFVLLLTKSNRFGFFGVCLLEKHTNPRAQFLFSHVLETCPGVETLNLGFNNLTALPPEVGPKPSSLEP